MKELAYLNKYLLKYKWYLFFGVVFTLISNLFGIVPAQVVRHALEMVKINIDSYFLFNGSSLQSTIYYDITKSIAIFGILILILAILKGIFLFAVRQTIIVMSRHIEYDLKNEIYAHYQTLPVSFYKKNTTGDLMARISEDVGKVRMYLGPSLMYLINMFILVFLIISYMFSVNARLTWYVLIPMPILSLTIFLVSSTINKKSEKIQKSLSNLSTFVQETFSGIRVIKSFAKEKFFFESFEKESLNYRAESLGLVRIDALFSPTIMFLIGLSTVICVYVGGQEIMAGTLSAGNITEFIMYVFMLTWPLTALGWTSGQIQRAAASQKRINEFLKTNSDIISGSIDNHEIEGEIRFENVSFTYNDTGIGALRNINFEVKKGQKLAIIGTTGSGKSTLAHLIFRMFDPEIGKIYIDGNDIRQYEVQNLRKQMVYVPQEVFLFSESIKNNIRFGDETKTDQDIEYAAKQAEIYENIVGFKEGFDTVVGERGITLSGGQKQRTTLARALIKKSKIVVLDDCLSAVDTSTENQILENLREVANNATTIIISHRVSNARLADKILVLDDGRITDEGTHDELINRPGQYRDLYEKQLLIEEPTIK